MALQIFCIGETILLDTFCLLLTCCRKNAKRKIPCNVLVLNFRIIETNVFVSFGYHSFQRKVEMFHEGLVSVFGENEDGYVAKTIALANCCPPFRYIYLNFIFFNPAKLLLFIRLQAEQFIGNWVCVHVCTVNRSFVERCVHSDPAVSEDSGRRANGALDKIVNLSVRVLNDRIFEHIRVSTSHTHICFT